MKCARCKSAQLHKLFLTVIVSFFGIFSVIGCQISCKSFVEISLDHNGEAMLSPSIFISDASGCTGPLTLVITANEAVVPNNTLNCTQVGQNIIAKITDSDSQISCWSTITLHDKQPPKFLNCIDKVVPCYTAIDDPILADVTTQDNCDPLPSYYFVDEVTESPCTNFTKTITRTHYASDNNGNTSSCTQLIQFESIALSDIDIPANTTIDCANPNLDPTNTGYPSVDNNSLLGNHCGIWIEYEDQTFPTCGSNSFKITRNWTIFDWCNNTPVTGTQFIEVIDTMPPTFICHTENIIYGTTSSHNCTGDISTLGVYAFDDCGSVTIEYSWAYENNPTNVPIGVYPVTATATDECGNSSTCTYNIEVKDVTAPIAICDSAFEISLSNDGTAQLTATEFDEDSYDNCGISQFYVSIDGVFFEEVTLNCSHVGTALEGILMVLDDCGNSSMCSSNITVVDNSLPTISCPNDITIVCHQDPNDLTLTGSATATDNCNVYTPTFTDIPALDECNIGSIVRTWSVVENGIDVSCTQNITIESEIPTIVFPPDVTISCGGDGGEPIVSNMCPGFFVGANLTEPAQTINCTRVTTKTWKVLNVCTDEIWEDEQIVTEIDNTPPVISSQANNVSIDCSTGDVTAALNDWLNTNGGANATDVCSDFVWTNNFVSLSDECASTGSATVTFTATDDCGNSASTTATVSVTDTTAPQFLVLPSDTTFSCNVKDLTLIGEYLANGANSVFEDNCSDATFNFSIDNPNGNTCGTFQVNYVLSDDCGNATNAIFFLTIVDEEFPVMNEEAKDLIINCDGDVGGDIATWLEINGGASAFDRCADIVWTNNFDGILPTCGTENAISVTFFATDACGNATPTTATVTVIDEVAPTFFVAPQNLELDCGGDLQTQIDIYLITGNGAIPADNCGEPRMSGEIQLGGDLCQAMDVLFTLTDECGNSSTATAQLTISDTNPPTIVTQPENIVIDCTNGTIESSIQDWLAANGNAVATDDCNEVSWTNNYDGLVPVCDGISTVSVVFTATDFCGNSTDATGTFAIDDSTPPTITNDPANLTVDCGAAEITEALDNWIATQGGGLASDNCSDVQWSVEIGESNDGCASTSTTAYVFTVTDDCGNSTDAPALLTIIDTLPAIMVAAPQDFVVECDGMGNTFFFDIWAQNFGGGFAEDACSDELTFDFMTTDTIMDCNSGNARTIVTSFTATDECGNVAETIANFIIEDTTEPTITCPEDIQSVDIDTSCENDIEMEDATASDVCAENLTFSFVVDLNSDGIDDISEQGANASGNYPVGVHLVTFNVSDECGNIGSCTQVVDVVDIVSPQITCNEFIIYLDENGEFPITPEIIGSFEDNCAPGNVSTDIDMVTCDNQPVITITMSATDGYGNPSSCSKIYAVVDTFGFCNGPQSEMAMISGKLFREDNTTLENANILLSDGMSSSTMTDENGEYSYTVNPGFNYTITPFKDDDPKNGVSTIDLIVLQQHILGAVPITSPYQLIAADANNSGSISTLDLVEIQQLILDMIPEFTNNTSWRFVEDDFVFVNNANPFATIFPETSSVNNLSGVTLNNDFVAIKIGDINMSANMNLNDNNLSSRNNTPTLLVAQNQIVGKNEEIEIPFAFNELQNIEGYQLQLNFDTDAFEFIGIGQSFLPNLTIENFGLDMVDKGIINTNWINKDQYVVEANEPIFTVILRPKVQATLKDLITTNSSSTYNEIYRKFENGVLYSSPLHLSIQDNIAIPITGNDQVILYQNSPNPFEDWTSIRFNLPQLTKSTVSIYDATGRLVWQVSKTLDAGEHKVTIESEALGLEGVYIYTLDTDFGRAVKKMILLSKF